MHGGVAKTDLSEENVQAVRDGFSNLKRHVENIRKFGIPAVVAINEFVADTEAEIAALKELCSEIKVPVELASVWANGADGGIDLAAERILESRISAMRNTLMLTPMLCAYASPS